MKLLLLLFSTAHISCSYSTDLVSVLSRCNRRFHDFNYCLSNTIHSGISQLTKPIPELNIPSLLPFKAAEVSAVFGDPITCLQQHYYNFEVFGFTNINSTNATFDTTTNILSINITFNGLLFTFDSEWNGRLITVPVNVDSLNNTATMVRPVFELTFALEEVERNGTRYYQAVNSTLNMVPEEFILNFTKIVDDPSLNDAINARINQEGNGNIDFLQGLFPQFWTQFFIVWLNNVLWGLPLDSLTPLLQQ